jgi:RHS repeat-associated protein
VQVVLLWCLLCAPLWAQSGLPSVTGYPLFGSFQNGGPDSINQNNLDVHLGIPLFHKAGRGLPLNFAINYDTAGWYAAYLSKTGTYGWTISGGFWSNPMNVSGYLVLNMVSEAPIWPHCDSYSPVYTDITGTAHAFPGFTLGSNCNGNDVTTFSPVLATDGSGYTLTGTNNQGASGWFVYDHSGNEIVPAALPYSVTDPNLNTISNVSGEAITDTLGMTAISSQFAQVNNTTQTYTYTYTGPNANEPIVTTYTALEVATDFGCNNNGTAVAEFPPTPVYLLTSIALPDGTSYSFTYETTPGTGNSGYVTGRISKVTLPTGGNIQYTYGYWPGTSAMCTDGSPATLTRTTSDGAVWQYSRNSTGTGTTVTDPAMNQTVFSFSAASTGYETQREVYQGSSSTGTLLRTVVRCYNGNFTNCSTASLTASAISRTDVYTTPANGTAALSETFYNTYGLVTQDNEFDYGIKTGAAPTATPLRSTMTTYATLGNYINDRPSCLQVTAGTSPNACGTVTSNTTSLTNYTYFPNETGNLETASYWTQGSNYLTRSYTYFSNGLVETATDVNSAVSTPTYQTCNYTPAYLSSVSAGGLTTSYTWDCNGGVVTQVSDPNSQPTKYTYESRWRIASITDPANNFTNHTYTPTTFESAMNFNGSTSTVDTLVTVDGLGRPILSQKKQTQGSTNFDSTQTTYGWTAGTGSITTVSMPYTGRAGQTAPSGTSVTTTQYDAIGRALTIVDGGTGEIAYAYSGNDVLQQSEPSVSGQILHYQPPPIYSQKQFQYNGLGQLTSVCEITSVSGAGNCNQSNSETGFLTKYTYDPLGNLLTVVQNSQSGAAGGQQNRTYIYDGLSRLTSESNPESGLKNYTYDSVVGGYCYISGSYSSFGDLVATSDANGNHVCYEYDALHRLTDVANNNQSAANACRRFRYDNSTGVEGKIPSGVTLTNVLGRVVEAETDSCEPWPPTTPITDEWFSYDARGENTDLYESTPNSGGYYHTNASYWANGSINTLSGVPGLSGWTFVPDGEGRPFSATYNTSPAIDWVKSATYYPTNPQTTVTFGTGDTDVYSFDATTGRMTGFQFTAGKAATTLTGTLGWSPGWVLNTLGITDGFNPSNTQSCNYVYDSLARISTVNCGANGSTNNVWSQNFTLDPFGNISKSGNSSFAASYLQPNGTTNNREVSVSNCVPTYDANGDLTTDCTSFITPASYTWNSYGEPAGLNGVGLTYDALGREAEIASGSTYTQVLYSPLGKLGLMNGQTPKTIRIRLPGGSTAQLSGASGGNQYTLHSDWLGSARLSTSYNGRAMVYDTAYAPYGESYAGAGNVTGDLNFTGQSEDTLSGLYDFLYREDSPGQGRWISPDPLGLNAVDITNPQTWNRYAYLMNNPLSNVDPTGLACAGLTYTLHACDEFNSPGFGSNWNEFATTTTTSIIVGTTEHIFTLFPDYDTNTWIVTPISAQTVYDTYTSILDVTSLTVSPEDQPIETLDNRTNALGRAINKTGVQNINNPCSIGAFYAVSTTSVALPIAAVSSVAAIPAEGGLFPGLLEAAQTVAKLVKAAGTPAAFAYNWIKQQVSAGCNANVNW